MTTTTERVPGRCVHGNHVDVGFAEKHISQPQVIHENIDVILENGLWDIPASLAKPVLMRDFGTALSQAGRRFEPNSAFVYFLKENSSQVVTRFLQNVPMRFDQDKLLPEFWNTVFAFDGLPESETLYSKSFSRMELIDRLKACADTEIYFPGTTVCEKLRNLAMVRCGPDGRRDVCVRLLWLREWTPPYLGPRLDHLGPDNSLRQSNNWNPRSSSNWVRASGRGGINRWKYFGS